VVEFCRNPGQKSFFTLFGKRTTLLRQFEKMLSVVTFVFAKLAGAEPVVRENAAEKLE